MKKIFVAAASALALAAAAPAMAASTVITADRMVDVLNGRVVEEPVIVITDGRIVSAVGRGGARPIIPEGATRIDLPGKTILPGLIDMHVHLDTNPLYGGYTGLQFTDTFWIAQGVRNAPDMLEAGFPTVRNVGCEGYADVGYKQAIDEGLMVGPRIVPAAHALSGTGGHCDQTYWPTSFSAKGKAVGDGP